MRSFVAILMVLWMVVPAFATILFDESFEGAAVCNTNATCTTSFQSIGFPLDTGLSTFSNMCQISNDVAHSGTKSVKLDYNGTNLTSAGDGLNCGPIKSYTTIPKTQWTRWWVYTVNSNYNTANCLSKFAFVTDPNAVPDIVPETGGNGCTSEMQIDVENEAGNQPCPGFGSGSCAYKSEYMLPPGPLVLIPDNTWTCVETFVDMNDIGQANGSIAVYINGTQTVFFGPSTGFGRQFRDANFPGFTAFVIYRQAGGGFRYWDDVAVGDQRIGCGTLPVPGAPVNLSVH